MPTASADNDDSPQLQQDPEQEEDEDDEADEDDEGIDLRPGAGSPGDSSEEEETDSEEEREIRKGNAHTPLGQLTQTGHMHFHSPRNDARAAATRWARELRLTPLHPALQNRLHRRRGRVAATQEASQEEAQSQSAPQDRTRRRRRRRQYESETQKGQRRRCVLLTRALSADRDGMYTDRCSQTCRV